MIKFYNLDILPNDKLEFAVILSKHRDKFIFVKHKNRDTWEIPGGKREIDESILETGVRELKEETGADSFEINPICEYSVTLNNETKYGRLFFATIRSFNPLSQFEIQEVKLFDKLPENLTYPNIQPKLFKEILLRTQNY